MNAPRPSSSLLEFLRTPTLSRTIVGLLTAAIAVLLLVNMATFMMIRRTEAFNQRVEHTLEVRLTAQRIMTLMVDAETAQRGYILTGREDYSASFDQAAAALPEEFEQLERRVSDNPEQLARLERLQDVARRRFGFISNSIGLARQGRIGEAVQMVRAGQGTVLMQAIRDQVSDIDAAESRALAERTQQSRRAATITVVVNAIAALLILILAAVGFWLIRRYVNEVVQAREALDRLNLGLESTVRERTAALTRANDEIQRFAYIVSHDLRAPLVNVMGYTAELEQAGKVLDQQIAKLETANPELIEQEAVTAVREDVPEAIGFIRASTQKMDRLINAILKLSREGRRSPTSERLDMDALVLQIADSVNHQVEAAGARITIGDLPTIESDRLSMEQIFGNLIDNAVKYLDTDRPGRIEVTGRHETGWVTYQIADNGRGISARDHERIFELFRRSGRQDRAGEGLGLAFVRNSVRRLGGEITVESELGKGSTFHLKFPTRLTVEFGDFV
jgi:signal transduction histidine kinase